MGRDRSIYNGRGPTNPSQEHEFDVAINNDELPWCLLLVIDSTSNSDQANAIELPIINTINESNIVIHIDHSSRGN